VRVKNFQDIKKLLIFFISISSAAHSQDDDQQRHRQYLHDSILISTPKLVRPQFKFDTRNTLFENHRVNMYGYDAGILVKNKLRITLGYYRIDETLNLVSGGTAIQQNIYIRCGTLNTELVYFHKRFLSLGFPLEFGVGYYDLQSGSRENNYSERLNGLVAFSNFGLAGTFTPIRWFGLKVIAGYRKAVLASNKKFDFNGIFSSIGLNVDLQEAIRDFRMYRLQKKYYRKEFKPLETFTDLLVN
jgi:hypothetical protein